MQPATIGRAGSPGGQNGETRSRAKLAEGAKSKKNKISSNLLALDPLRALRALRESFLLGGRAGASGRKSTRLNSSHVKTSSAVCCSERNATSCQCES